MNNTRIFYILVLLLTLAPVFAQNNTNDIPLNGGKIIVDGKEFYLYKTKKSEGFYAITRKFGVSKEEIIQYNPEAAEGLKLGQIIKLPVIQGRNSNQAELDESSDYLYHTVDSGQTLFFISHKYGVDEEEITKLNPGTDKVLLYGTQLRIPVVKMIQKPSRTDGDYIYHKVKPKESLYAISRIYNVTVKAIIDVNPGLGTAILQPEDEIRIPRIRPDQQSSATSSPTLESHTETQMEEDRNWEDSTFFYHYVVKDDNLFNITQRYNARIKDVLEVNNLSRSDGVKLGYYLKIPKSAIKSAIPEQQGKQHLVYKTIDRNESITDIAQKFGLPEEDIVKLNPQVEKWKRLKRGTLVNIPIEKKFGEPKQATAVEENKVKPVNVDSLLIAEAFLVGCDTLGVDRSWNIAILWPLFLEENDTINNIKEVSAEGDTILKIRDPKIIAYDRNGFREFYTGVLIAIDSLVKKGMVINLYTFDVGRDTNMIHELITDGSLSSMDLIFGPVYSDQISSVSEFCKEKSIRMIAPYPIDSKILNNNPFIFQVSSSQEAFYKPAVEFIVDNYAGQNIIVVKGDEKDDREEHFSAYLKRELYRHRMDQFAPVYFNEINFDSYSYAGFEKLIRNDMENLVIIPSKKMALFNRVAPNIENLIYKKNVKNISLFGFPEWLKLQGREKEMLFLINTVFYSPFHVDFTQDLTLDVTRRFREIASTEPTAEGMVSYGLLGYDVAFYFISALNAFGNDFDRCLPYLNVDLTTSGFKFYRTNNWSGFENRNTYFIRYDRNFDVKLLDQY